MSRNLYTAFDQWAHRPPDERFRDFESLLTYCKRKRDVAQEGQIRYSKVRVTPDNGAVKLLFPNGKTAGFTNWSFGVLASRTGTRADSVQDLSPELACDVMNFRMEKMKDEGDEREARVLLATEGANWTARAFNGNAYTRIWDYQIVERLMALQEDGWAVPPAYDQGEWGAEIKQGGGGLYASDRDLFVFMVNDQNRINNGTDQGLARGFFCGNSEVGGGAYVLTFFLYDFICGNHIVWGATEVERQAIRHIGDAIGGSEHLLDEMLVRYSGASSLQLEADIKSAQKFQLGKDPEEVEELVFSKRIATRTTIKAALNMAERFEDVHGNPLSAWGLASGITRVSQLAEFSQKRVELDQSAGKVLSLVN